MTKLFALTSLVPVDHPRQRTAIKSWRDADLEIYSFNRPDEIKTLEKLYKRVTFVPVEETTERLFGKACVPIHVMCRWATTADAYVLILNSDIEVRLSGSELRRIRRMIDGGICSFIRYNYDSDSHHSAPDNWGLDAFLFHGRQGTFVPDSSLSMGQPWWDYWLPFMFLKNARTLWSVEFPAIFHRNHAQNWSWENWHRCGLEFNRFVNMLGDDRSRDACHRMSFQARDELTRRRIAVERKDV